MAWCCGLTATSIGLSVGLGHVGLLLFVEVLLCCGRQTGGNLAIVFIAGLRSPSTYLQAGPNSYDAVMPICRSLKIAWGIALTFACALIFLVPDALHVGQALLTLVILSALCLVILHCWRTGAYPLAIAIAICGLGVLAGVLMRLAISFSV